MVFGGPRSGVGPLSRRDVQRLESPRKTVPVSDTAPHSKLVENTVIKRHEHFAVRGEVDRAGGSGLWTVQRIGDTKSLHPTGSRPAAVEPVHQRLGHVVD